MTIRALAPASSANLGPAFDSAAVALDLWNELDGGRDAGIVHRRDRRRRCRRPAARRARIWPCRHSRSTRPSRAGSFRFDNRIPLERGLGSSAAAIALGLVAGAAAAGQRPSAGELLERGLAFEGHADNLSAALHGGVCVAWQNGSVHAARIATSLPLALIVAVPAAQTNTADSRDGLPATVSHEDAAANAGYAAMLGAAIASGDAALLGCALHDRLHERYRAETSSLFQHLTEHAPDGAVGLTLSGSGPSVVVWAPHERAAEIAAELAARGPKRRQGAPPASGPGRSTTRMSDNGTSAYGPTHPAKRNSAALTDGVDRAPARAMLKGAGFTDADLAKPLIGVATTWIETMPCNLNHRVLARYVKQGIREAGGTPLEFNTIAVSDGVTMGAAGMRASLVSREVIADSIELVTRGHHFDGLVCIVGCDKTIPAAVMALARLDIPGLVLYGGTIAAGRYRGKDVTLQDVFEAVGAHAAGTISDREVHALESVACPGAGACGGHFTANTMATALDFLGVSAPGLNEVPAMHPGKPKAAVAAGRLAMKLVVDDVRPSSVLTREAFENAITAIAATGGSTNGVLHLLAIADEIGVELSIDDFDTISSRTPIVADIKPGGRYVATDLFKAGGVALVARELVRAGLVNEDAVAVDGRTLRQVADGARERKGQDVVVSWDDPLKPTGGLAILKGNLAPEGCVVKLAGHERVLHRGPARVFDSEEACFAAVKARAIEPGDVVVIRYEGPGRRSGHARDAARHRGARRRRARRRGGADHRRPLLGCDARPDGRPHRTRGLPRRSARARPRRRHRRRRRRQPRARRRGRRCRAREARSDVDAARAALHERRLREVRGGRRLRLRRSRDAIAPQRCSRCLIERVAWPMRCSFSTRAKRT